MYVNTLHFNGRDYIVNLLESHLSPNIWRLVLVTERGVNLT